MKHEIKAAHYGISPLNAYRHISQHLLHTVYMSHQICDTLKSWYLSKQLTQPNYVTLSCTSKAGPGDLHVNNIVYK